MLECSSNLRCKTIIFSFEAWQELSQIAIKLFNLVTSSAASERNFSTMGFVHSKERNRVNPDTVEKLVFIKSNIHASDHSGVRISDVTDASDHSTQDSSCESEQHTPRMISHHKLLTCTGIRGVSMKYSELRVQNSTGSTVLVHGTTSIVDY